MEQQELSTVLMVLSITIELHWKQFLIWIKLKNYMTYDLAVLLLGILGATRCFRVCIKRRFLEALFKIVPNYWKEPKYPSVIEWINKVSYNVYGNTILWNIIWERKWINYSHAATWMNMKNISKKSSDAKN